MLSGASNFTDQIDKVFLWILGISVFFLVLITFLMIFFVIKYRRSKNTKAENIHGNTLLEITWTVIPTILVLGMFYYGWVSYSMMKNVPEGAETIKVIGRMWSWEFEYKNGLKTDTLYLPINMPIKLDLASQDVLHGFYVPAFRVKRDVVPGISNWIWFEPKILGSYDILCTEYCGLEHSYMLATLTVLPQNEFNEWFQKNSPDSSQGSTEMVSTISEGKKLMATKGCIACHSTDGSKSVGPTLLGVYGKKVAVLTDDKERQVLFDEEYFKKSLFDPEADVTKGFEALMSSSEGELSEKEMAELLDFIKSLK
jgi:cytochrome c oxidase subunit II